MTVSRELVLCSSLLVQTQLEMINFGRPHDCMPEDTSFSFLAIVKLFNQEVIASREKKAL